MEYSGVDEDGLRCLAAIFTRLKMLLALLLMIFLSFEHFAN